MDTPKYQDTKTVFVSETLRGTVLPRLVKLYQVKHKRDAATVFGPATWKECCAYRQGLAGSPRSRRT